MSKYGNCVMLHDDLRALQIQFECKFFYRNQAQLLKNASVASYYLKMTICIPLLNGASFGKSQLLNGVNFCKSKHKQNIHSFKRNELICFWLGIIDRTPLASH